MVGSSPKKHKSNLQTRRSKDQSRLGKTSTGRKVDKASPLLNKVFYLDLKNPTLSRNLQKSLLELGATVELFLVQEVNYVVTDRNQWLTGSGSNAPPPSPFLSASPASSVTSVNSPSFNEVNKRSKTRAECMLDKVRNRPQQFTLDPLDNARRWGITIHSYEKVAASVEKLLIRQQRSHSQPTTVNLKAPYIKFESFKRDSRPTYGELGAWPSLNLSGSAGSCPFLESRSEEEEVSDRSSSQDEKRATPQRRTQSRMTRLGVGSCPSRPGNCELCNVRYTSLRRHLDSEAHASAAGCVDNFAALDSLIARGPAMFEDDTN